MKRLIFAAITVGSILALVPSQAADYRVETIAGSSRLAQKSGDGGLAVAASLGDIYWLYRGPDGTLYFDETSKNNVRAFTIGGVIRRFAGNGKAGAPPLTPGLAADVALGLIQGGDVDPISPIAFLNAFNHSQIVGVNLKTGRAFIAAGVPARSGPESGPADQVATGGIISLCVAQGSNPSTGQKGVLFFTDIRLQKIRRLRYDFDPETGGIKNGVVDVVAGAGEGFTPEGPALGAKIQIGSSSGMTYASNLKKLMFVQNVNRAITTVEFPSGPAGTSGNIALIAGIPGSTPSSCSDGEGGQATAASINPNGIAFDPKTSNVYFTSASYNCVRMFRIGGTIATVAGTGLATDSGLGGPATQASVSRPRGIVVDPVSSAVYIAASGTRRILRLQNGIVDSVAGVGPAGGLIAKPTPERLAPLGKISDGAIAADGVVYLLDGLHSVINRLDLKSRLVSLLAGNGINAVNPNDRVRATMVSLSTPAGLAADSKGNVYLAETSSNSIRRIDRVGIIHLYAGTPGVRGFLGDGGPAAVAKLTEPDAEFYSNATGTLYFHEYGRFRRVDQKGIISTIAGIGHTAGVEDSPDGTPATEAKLDGAAGATHIWVDDRSRPETVYFTEPLINKVKKFSLGGAIVTVAGTNGAGSNVEGVPATTALLKAPTGIVGDGKGNLYIAERDSHRIRRIDAKGNITTVIGGTAVPLNSPQTLAIDSAGRLLVFDSGVNQVFRLKAF